MNPINASTERFEAVEILTVPGLFTSQRVDRTTLPPWMHLYEMQTDPDDWSQPCLLGRHITVEHFGTVLTASLFLCRQAAMWIWPPATLMSGKGRNV